MKTRSVERFKSYNYLKKSQELKNSMERAFESEDWNSVVINAVHCAILAADAFCVFKKGVRNASENHNDAIVLFLSVDHGNEEIKRNASHLTRLLGIKTDADYGENLASVKDAEQAKKHAERLFDFVKSKIILL